MEAPFLGDRPRRQPLASASIEVAVTSSKARGAGLTQHTVYALEGRDPSGPFSTLRRYSDFHSLRLALLRRFPGCFVPSIPEKSLLKHDAQLVRRRTRYLDGFVRRVAQLPHLYFSEEFQALVRAKEQDIAATLSGWATPSVPEIIGRYKEAFA